MKNKFFLFLMIFLIMLVLSSPVLSQFNYYIRDHLGNTRVVLDEKGNTKEYYDYEPFGLSLREKITGSEQARYKFTGKELDDRNNLNWYDFGARYYDPAIGRWLSPDPLGGKYPSLSPYVYCGNNPLIFIDPTGMDTLQAEQLNQILGQTHNNYQNQSLVCNTATFEALREYLTKQGVNLPDEIFYGNNGNLLSADQIIANLMNSDLFRRKFK